MKKSGIFVHITANVVIILCVVLVAAAGLIDYGVIGTGAGGDKAIYRGNASKPYVTPMINVYWGEEYLPEILEILDRFEVKTTFFVGGSWVAKHPELLKSIAAAGHEIGNHGYLHKDAAKLDLKQNLAEIELCSKQVAALTGKGTDLFAPPSGSLSQAMFQSAETLGHRVIMWSKDTIDWRDKDSDLVFKRATNGIQNGDLILMHPTRHTADALPEILKFYRDNGYRVVTVSENIAPDVN